MERTLVKQLQEIFEKNFYFQHNNGFFHLVFIYFSKSSGHGGMVISNSGLGILFQLTVVLKFNETISGIHLSIYTVVTFEVFYANAN